MMEELWKAAMESAAKVASDLAVHAAKRDEALTDDDDDWTHGVVFGSEMTADNLESAIRAMPMPEGWGPRIKPLVWKQTSELPVRFEGYPTDIFDARYLVWRRVDQQPWVWAWGKDGVGVEGVHASVEAAQYAAQADYERRIRECLE